MSCTDTLTGPGGPGIERAVPALAGTMILASLAAEVPFTTAAGMP